MRTAGALTELLAEHRLIVLDGGMGTELQARGVPMDSHAWSAVANIAQHDVVRTVHEDYIRAGADVLIANTYAAARPPLAAAGMDGAVARINERAVEAALTARDRVAERSVVVAGSLSHVQMGASPREWPRGDEGLLGVYHEQAQILAGAGADLLVVEMASATEWVLPALAAASETGLPVWLGMSAQPGPTLRARGHEETSFAALSADLTSASVDAIFVMHTEVDQVGEALDVVFADWHVPVGVYPNSGTFTSPHWVFGDISPARLVAEARGWNARGVRLIGGCCGIGPAHIAALRAELVVNC